MVRETYSDAAVAKRLSGMIAVKLEVHDEKAKAKAEELGIEGPPTIIYFDADGKEKARFKGFRPPAEFLAFLDEVEKPAKATDKTPEKSTN